MKKFTKGLIFLLFFACTSVHAEENKAEKAQVKFAYPVIGVKDINRSKDFYTKVLEIPLINSGSDSYYIKGKIGFVRQEQLDRIAFKNPEASKKSADPERVWLYFESNDLEEIFERVKKSGVTIIHGIEEQFWGQSSFRFYDPDGHIVDISDQRSLDF